MLKIIQQIRGRIQTQAVLSCNLLLFCLALRQYDLRGSLRKHCMVVEITYPCKGGREGERKWGRESEKEGRKAGRKGEKKHKITVSDAELADFCAIP